MSDNHFAVKLKRSLAGRPRSQRAILEGMGLRRFGRIVLLPDTPSTRGMLYKVNHMVELERREGAVPAKG